jgi:hypothetical protein
MATRWGQTEFQVNLKLGLTPCPRPHAPLLGGRTFVGNEIDAASLLEENARQFMAGWGLGAPPGRPIALQPGSSTPEFLD